MNKQTSSTFKSFAVVLLCAFALQPAHAAVQWSSSLADAQVQAKQTGELTMVDVYTDWCGWCKKLDSDVYTSPDVSKASLKFACVKVNAEKEGTAFAAKFNIQAYPTIVFVDPHGNKFAKIEGYEPANRFAASLATIEDSWTRLPTLTAAVKANPHDGPSAADLAIIDANRGVVDDAVQLVATVKSNVPDRLVSVYDAIGDAYVDQGDSISAATWYDKIISVGKPQDAVISARISLVQLANKTGDKAATKVQLIALLAIPDLPAQVKTGATNALRQINSGK